MKQILVFKISQILSLALQNITSIRSYNTYVIRQLPIEYNLQSVFKRGFSREESLHRGTCC